MTVTLCIRQGSKRNDDSVSVEKLDWSAESQVLIPSEHLWCDFKCRPWAGRGPLSTLSPSTGSQELSLLCPVRALRVYIEHSASYRKSEQLFVSFGNRAKGGPITMQGISRWLVDAITLAYSSLGLQCPIGVRAHSWSSPSAFVRFYNLDVPALQARVLSA